MFDQSNFGSGGRPPIDVNMEKVKKLMRVLVPVLAVVIVAIIVAGGSFYTINSGNEAVVTRWGRYVRTEATPGLQFKIPFIENKYNVNTEEVRRLEFGMRSNADGSYTEIIAEALMLTQEENLVVADWVVQYRVSNSYNYLFKVEKQEQALRMMTESAYRRVTAAHPLDDILTNRKDDMQREIMADLQDLCNKYELGVQITAVQLQDASAPDEVREAFLDVTRALEDKSAKQNQARQYENENLPVARGEAEKMLNEARAYKEKRINEAEGAVARYLSIQAEYKNQPDVMRTRLYLEMIQDVMPQVDKIYFVSPSNGNLIEFLPLTGAIQSLE